MQGVIKKCFRYTPSAYITLMSVLVVGAVGGAIAVSLMLLGFGSSRTSFAAEQSIQAQALANACLEEALQRVRESTSFTGNGDLTLGSGSCAFSVTSQGPENRTLEISGTIGTIIQRTVVTIEEIDPRIIVTSWQEVSDF